MPLAVEINVALREQNCQKVGSERVNHCACDSAQLPNFLLTLFIGNWTEKFNRVQRRRYDTIVNIIGWINYAWNLTYVQEAY